MTTRRKARENAAVAIPEADPKAATGKTTYTQEEIEALKQDWRKEGAAAEIERVEALKEQYRKEGAAEEVKRRAETEAAEAEEGLKEVEQALEGVAQAERRQDEEEEEAAAKPKKKKAKRVRNKVKPVPAAKFGSTNTLCILVNADFVAEVERGIELESGTYRQTHEYHLTSRTNLLTGDSWTAAKEASRLNGLVVKFDVGDGPFKRDAVGEQVHEALKRHLFMDESGLERPTRDQFKDRRPRPMCWLRRGYRGHFFIADPDLRTNKLTGYEIECLFSGKKDKEAILFVDVPLLAAKWRDDFINEMFKVKPKWDGVISFEEPGVVIGKAELSDDAKEKRERLAKKVTAAKEKRRLELVRESERDRLAEEKRHRREAGGANSEQVLRMIGKGENTTKRRKVNPKEGGRINQFQADGDGDERADGDHGEESDEEDVNDSSSDDSSDDEDEEAKD